MIADDDRVIAARRHQTAGSGVIHAVGDLFKRVDLARDNRSAGPRSAPALPPRLRFKETQCEERETQHHSQPCVFLLSCIASRSYELKSLTAWNFPFGVWLPGNIHLAGGWKSGNRRRLPFSARNVLSETFGRACAGRSALDPFAPARYHACHCLAVNFQLGL